MERNRLAQAELNRLANEIRRKTGYQVYPQKRIAFFHKLKEGEPISDQDKRFSIWFAETGEEHFFTHYFDAISFLKEKLR